MITIYIYDDFLRLETEFNTWKFSTDELQQIQDVVDKWVDEDDFIDMKWRGCHQDSILPHEVLDYLNEWING